MRLTNVLSIRSTSKTGATPALLHSAASLALGSFGAKASGAIPVLTECLASTNGRVAAAAAVALAKIGATPEKVVPLIVSHLPDTNFDPADRSVFRAHQNLMMNIWALGEYGPKGRSALPALSNLLSSRNVNARSAARIAIQRINGESDPIP